ncbi:MAG: tRNA (N6-isopentenyl adenosine(37)-C2)-methylthiotransferase MiaB [Clostridia bacterium]|nr:tRNA (N6-isopentenyl adenosine(37)-C2)-methylthiotransferase MiaB [Clostridia bacterium]
MKYLIKTYGCQMNVHESEKLAGILENMGYKVCEDEKDADLILFNTCAIRESAEQKIFAHIGELKKLKAQKKDMIIAICGCMSQQTGYPENILKKFPFVDIIFGTHNISELEDFILKRKSLKKKVVDIKENEDISNRDLMPKKRTSGINAWVNIMYGCNNFCTYCIVPYVRGREVSRPINDIKKEVENVVKEGYKQVTLLGQNVNSYGNDVGDENVNFANLLKTLDEIEGDFRLTFMTSHPKDISKEVIDIIAGSKHILHYLHLPVQSGSDKVLKAMNRRYTAENYFEKIEYAKSKIPDIEFSSDIIVGFPGETEEDFNDTMELVKKVQYEQLFMFIYSKRKGTVAEKMGNQVDLATKKDRLKRLIALQNEIGSKVAEKYIGKTVDVLVSDVHPKKQGYLIGTTFTNKNVNFAGDRSLIGKTVKVKIQSSKLTVLYGIMEEN